LGPEDSMLLGAFAQGVNDYIARRGLRLPLEFLLLRYRPQPWRPQDSLALAAYMYQALGSDYKTKMRRETFTAALGPALEQQLYPERSPWDIVPGGPLPPAAPVRPFGFRRRGDASGGGGAAALPVFAAPALPDDPPRGGSNNWVLAGRRSFSGLPILANDPHLQFQVPGLWWAAQLTVPGAGGFSVEGVAIAGTPGIIIGHNQHIAWGDTNAEADIQDLYREQLDGKGNVLTAAGWRPLTHWHESIPVRGAKPVALDIEVTPHGPIIASDAGGPLALNWTLYAPGALAATSVFLHLDQARNWSEFEAALSHFAGPPQNFVYADTAGHIGFQCAGWVPVRRGFDGSMPVPGSDARYGWQGWIPFSQMPRVFDPASGLLATANARITPDDYPYTITTDWDAPNRTRRIYQILQQLPRWNASAMGRVQADVISEQDASFARALLAAGAAERAAGTPLPATAERALAMLRGFRGAMGHTSAAPTLAFLTRQEFLRRVLSAKVGDPTARQYRWHRAPVFEQWLLATHPRQWLPPGYADWNALLVASLEGVAAETTLEAPAVHWGKYETLSILHPVYSHIPLLRNSADLGPVEINGSPLTVKQARNVELGNIHDLGPSMRFVADLADWDRSTLTLEAGESGEPFSRHYRDEFPAYLSARGLPLWFSPAAVAAHRRHHLQLSPLGGQR
ncbi:MAG TPA: penicillin acylase family protein, partial [Terriglobales bacterium]|nr:penicillin acylase family protein [Terriglobales bacterium]